MLNMLLSIAIARGDVIELEIGELTRDYGAEIDKATEGLTMNSSEEDLAAGEIEFNKIWEEICEELGIEGEGKFLSIERGENKVVELIAVDEEFHEALTGAGREIRYDPTLAEHR